MDGSVTNLLAQAVRHHVAGDLIQAMVLFRDILARDPANVVANHQLGLFAFNNGDPATAALLLGQAIAGDPTDPELHNNLGVALFALQRHGAAADCFERALALKPDFAEALNNLGSAREAEGAFDAAVTAFRQALACDPANIDTRANLDRVCSRAVPQWHFPMMNEETRNHAYDTALRRAVRGRQVLDIGSGGGLLAMMAARAGAAHVTSCEAVPEIAALAREIVAANGLSDRITLLAKHSGSLAVGTDLPERADVLVTEIFASGILSEHILPTLEHARRELLKPGAVIIPRRATARAYLIGGRAIETQFFAFQAAGFTLASFNKFAPMKLGFHLDHVPHDVLSDDFEIFDFDLEQDGIAADQREIVVPTTRAGRCVGVAQWLRLELDAEIRYENRPSPNAETSGWMHVLYRFREPLPVQAGDTVCLVASHNGTAMTVTLAT